METTKHLEKALGAAIKEATKANNESDLAVLISRWAAKINKANEENTSLLTEQDVASRYPFLDVRRLRNWRARAAGPPYIKLGKARQSRVYYRVSSIEKWLDDMEIKEG